MIIDIYNLEIETREDSYEAVKTVLTTIKGTVPFNREMGIDISVLDLPFPFAKDLLTYEYKRNIEKYIKSANIASINFEINKSKIVPKVVIKFDDWRFTRGWIYKCKYRWVD